MLRHPAGDHYVKEDICDGLTPVVAFFLYPPVSVKIEEVWVIVFVYAAVPFYLILKIQL